MLKCKRIYEDLAPSVVCNTSSRVQKSHQSICQYVHMISLPSGQQNYAEQINPILNVSIQLISACTERQEINLFRISPLYFSGDFTQDAAVISISSPVSPYNKADIFIIIRIHICTLHKFLLSISQIKCNRKLTSLKSIQSSLL